MEAVTYRMDKTYDELIKENMSLRQEVINKDYKIEELETALGVVCKTWLKQG